MVADYFLFTNLSSSNMEAPVQAQLTSLRLHIAEAIATAGVRLYPDHWATFFSDVSTLVQIDESGEGRKGQIGSKVALECGLEIAGLFPIQLDRIRLPPSKREEIENSAIRDFGGPLLQLVEAGVGVGGQEAVCTKAFSCLGAWVDHMPVEDFSEFLNAIVPVIGMSCSSILQTLEYSVGCCPCLTSL